MNADLIAGIKRWQTDPSQMVRDLFNVEPDTWQIDVLNNFQKHQRIALKASKGPGKSTVLSWCAWNFLLTRPHPKIAATSISKDNLSDGLWTEMAKWMNKSLLLKHMFTWNKTRIFCNEYPETWYMSSRTWSKSADSQSQADTLAGLHADYLLFIIDEAGGVPDAVVAAAEAGLATGIETKLLMAGNPTHLSGPLYRATTKERHLWFLKEITSDPDDPDRAPRVSIKWAREQVEKYGRDNPWVLVNVFGQFPPSSLNTLLGPNDVSKAMGKHLTPDVYEASQKRLGIDCARFGDDKSVIFPRQGLAAFRPVELRDARTNEIASRVMLSKSRWKSELEFVDDTGGYGAGVVDSLIQAGQNPTPVNFAGKADDPTQFVNKRAEIYFRMANWIKRGGAIPNMPELAGELTAPTYTFKNGKFLIEPKDQIKERLGRSPDLSDALALTFSVEEMPAHNPLTALLQKDNYKSEWNPL
jgi:hypothetical protein